MGIMVYSLKWVMQDFVHQPYRKGSTRVAMWSRRVLLGEMQGGLMSPNRGLGVYCSIWVLEYHTLILFWDLVLKLDHYDNSLNPKPSTNPKPFTFFSLGHFKAQVYL